MSFLAYCAAFVALGFAVGHRLALVPAAALFPLYVLGVRVGWWGHGVGDGWEYALVLATLAAVVATAGGLGLRRLLLSFATR